MKDYPAAQELTFEAVQKIGRRETLTTTQIARVLQVTPHAARTGMDGKAYKKPWKVPGSRFRRMLRTDLIEHMREMPHKNADAIDPVAVELVHESNGKINGTVHCADGFTLGMALAGRATREIIIHKDAMADDVLESLIEQVKAKFAEIHLQPPPIRIVESH